MTNVLALPSGTELVGDFRIERVLGAGGFGMTYLAEEIALARQVTIKEYFPTDFAARGDALAAVPRDAEAGADFQWGLDRFIDEAQTLARFDHPNIVKVYRYFRANGTAYMVLQFEQGQSLKGWLKSLGRAPRQREVDDIVRPLLEALEVIHAADFLHRDIAPDNIIIRKDGSPVLIDFGSARGDIAKHSRTVSALVKPGYSPYEQYAENGVRQGPWTDIYALGATLYHAIAGKRPPDAPSRIVNDELMPAREAALGAYRAGFLAAIDKALALDTNRRPQSIMAWRGDLLAPEPGAARSGWFRRPAQDPANARPDKTRKLTVALGSMPPPPDVPGAQGGLLDYIDGLKKKDAPAPPAPGPAAASAATIAITAPGRTTVPDRAPGKAVEAAAAAAPLGARRAASKPSATGASAPSNSWSWFGPGKPATAPPTVKEPTAPKVKPARPKPMPAISRGQWRSFAFKFAIGIAIAGAAVALQDRVAPVDSKLRTASQAPRTSTVVTNAVREAPRMSMLAGHRGGTTAVNFTEDGRSVVTTGADASLKVWSAATGSLARTIPLDDGAATALAVIGRRALTGHTTGRIDLWDLDSGTRVARFKGSDGSVRSLAFAQDARYFIASSHDWTVAIWDVNASAAPAAVIDAHDDAVQVVASGNRGSYFATGGADKTVKLWRTGDSRAVRTYRGHKDLVTALAVSPEGRYVAAAALDGRIRVWTTNSTSLYRLNSSHKGRVNGIAFSPGGDMIASTGEDGSVQLWQFKQSRSVRAIAEQAGPSSSLAFSPDGSRVAVASAEGTVRFWDAAAPARPRSQ